MNWRRERDSNSQVREDAAFRVRWNTNYPIPPDEARQIKSRIIALTKKLVKGPFNAHRLQGLAPGEAQPPH